MKGVIVMKVRQAPPVPRSLVILKGQAVATYDAVAFLDTRAQDLGGRVADPATLGVVHKREDQRLEIAVAIAVILASLSFVVLLSLKLT
jgi:hypothetical protein